MCSILLSMYIMSIPGTGFWTKCDTLHFDSWKKKYYCLYYLFFVKFNILKLTPSKLMDSPSPCSSRRGSYTPVTSSSAASTSLGNTKVSDLKLILVNAVVAGLEIASSVAFTFIPPLLLKSGYSETQMDHHIWCG